MSVKDLREELVKRDVALARSRAARRKEKRSERARDRTFAATSLGGAGGGFLGGLNSGAGLKIGTFPFELAAAGATLAISHWKDYSDGWDFGQGLFAYWLGSTVRGWIGAKGMGNPFAFLGVSGPEHSGPVGYSPAIIGNEAAQAYRAFVDEEQDAAAADVPHTANDLLARMERAGL